MKMIRALAVCATVLSCAAPAMAQNYPSHQIKIIVSTSAGGVTDLAARIVGQEISTKTGQNVVVENRPGGSGNIAMDALAKAEPDGYTLGVANTGNIVINPFLFKNLSYDPLKDLLPVAEIGTVPLFLVVNPQLGVKTVQQFVAYAKKNPDKFSYASAGAGTTPDLAAHDFENRAGVKFVFVPFRGTTPAVEAVLGGHVQATFISMGPHIDLFRTGRLIVIGQATEKRVPYMADVPTFAEQGYPGFVAGTWFSLFAPKGTPPAVVDKLNGIVRNLSPDLKKKLEANFVDLSDKTAAQFQAQVTADAARWEKIVKDTGVSMK